MAYLQDFARRHNLECRLDETGNVLIRKPATKGYENRKTTVLQSHMDMVCEKIAGLDFDFSKDAIQTKVEGEWMTAQGTTLGADDGIGGAIQLAVLADDTLEHGPLECLFTRSEETSLVGASNLDPHLLKGEYLINLDSEDEGQIFINGEEVTIQSPRDAFRYGIGMIHQHFKLVDVFTATENIILGLEEKGRLDRAAASRKIYRRTA